MRTLFPLSLVIACTPKPVATPTELRSEPTKSEPTAGHQWVAIGDPTLYGDVDLRLEGAEPATIRSAAWCEPERGAIHIEVTRNDAELDVQEDGWFFGGAVMEDGQYGLEFHEVLPGRPRTEFTWRGKSPAGLVTADGTAQTIDVELTEKGGTRKMRLRGTVRCPKPDSASRVPPELVKVLAEISGATPRPYLFVHHLDYREPRVVSVLLEGRTARALVSRVQARLPAGFIAFVGGIEHNGDEFMSQLAIAAVTSDLDLLRYARTDGGNYDITTEGLIQRLHAWDLRYGIDIVGAGHDFVDLRLQRPPKPGRAFAEEVYALCPDSVDQGVGSIAALTELVEAGELFLWWG